MPCTAKKFEAARPEMAQNGIADVDAVLTTRELARLIRMRGIDFQHMPAEGPDTPFGERTSAGKLFGATGGVMEAAIRTAHYLVTGAELADFTVTAVRGLEGVKEARVTVNGMEFGVAVVSGVGNVGRILDEIRAGREDLHFIEVMTCPGGCISGGGQPFQANRQAPPGSGCRPYTESMPANRCADRTRTRLSAASTRSISGEPLGHRSHQLLHTHYKASEVLV